MSYQSFEQVLQKCHTEEKEFWQVILEDPRCARSKSAFPQRNSPQSRPV